MFVNKYSVPSSNSRRVVKQLSQMQRYRDAAHSAYDAILEDEKRVKLIVDRMVKPSTNPLPSSSDHRSTVHITQPSSSRLSQAELTILLNNNMIEQVDQQWFPIHLLSRERSDFPWGFRGCFGCGNNQHQFPSCPERTNSSAQSRFKKNYSLHFQHHSTLPQPPSSNLNNTPPLFSTTLHTPAHTETSDQPTLSPPFPPMGHQLSPLHYFRWVVVAPVLNLHGSLNLHPHPRPNDPNRIFVITSQIAQVNLLNTTTIRPMPIRINNRLLHIHLSLGPETSNDRITLRTTYDTGAGIKTGFLPLHLFIHDTFPSVVHSFEQLNDTNPFQPIIILGAIRVVTPYDECIHTHLTAVIRYYSGLSDTNNSPILFVFALGDGKSVNTILGLPTMKNMGMDLSLTANKVISSYLNCFWPLHHYETSRGIPTSSTPVHLTLPSTNATPTTSTEPTTTSSIDTTVSNINHAVIPSSDDL